jgi:Cft2 family RNA processing exonuclease
MKNIIKKLIKESIDNLSQDELNKINDISNKRYQENQKEIEENKINIKNWQTVIDNIKKTNTIDDKMKEIISKDIYQKIQYAQTYLKNFQNQSKDSIYKSVYNKFVNNKKYQQEIELQRKNKTFTNQDIEDLFVTALEGGSNYWYYIKNIPKEIKYQVKQLKQPLADAIAKHVIDGGYIQFFDVEDENELLGTVDMDKLLEAISLLKKDYPDTWNNILDEDCDADCADIFLQLAVMGDIVFG